MSLATSASRSASGLAVVYAAFLVVLLAHLRPRANCISLRQPRPVPLAGRLAGAFSVAPTCGAVLIVLS